MSGAFPISTAKFESLGIRSIQNTIISKTVSGKKLARQIDNQRFAFSVRIITGKRSDVYGELMAFIVKQRSGKENFTIIPPEVEDARGNVSGTVLVNGVHAVGDTTITVDAMTGTLKAGDFIKFAGHSKVYMVVADVTADGSNEATVTIEPPLITALANNEVVTYDNVAFTVHLTNDMQEFGVAGADKDGALLYQFEFDVEESL
ncbi:major capsid protein [uncultured Mediterranean phage uvMED]|nr:major capsid protein [uncultured Mediterranean phage uvMED]BAR20188.1 major capsid protein [uncultured Mediterranean phage uvMED]BAR20204.1 major capsid protein [uncultured Mediterranean phage uvMED]BAR38353.1 major capsid protein [uncultured Mediterranean phage uvMED]